MVSHWSAAFFYLAGERFWPAKDMNLLFQHYINGASFCRGLLTCIGFRCLFKCKMATAFQLVILEKGRATSDSQLLRAPVASPGALLSAVVVFQVVPVAAAIVVFSFPGVLRLPLPFFFYFHSLGSQQFLSAHQLFLSFPLPPQHPFLNLQLAASCS